MIISQSLCHPVEVVRYFLKFQSLQAKSFLIIMVGNFLDTICNVLYRSVNGSRQLFQHKQTANNTDSTYHRNPQQSPLQPWLCCRAGGLRSSKYL